ncbi:hypothetical protein QRX25_10400 [Bacillus sp. L381]|uniref:hypothetical protein n=1 Tax=Bacillus TaxID=1386 RepID=UPI001BA7972D|nr:MULTISPECIES: hypothetical protein [Bacillus]MCR9040952.1 hypothetical protein [Bacillus velezensis]MEC3841568.1 hypothetical protein [Bacillus amyloliquefaciens]QUN07964.1 hypothetical protein KEF49_10255 [Bacillus amyloliquefaciens]QYM81030.1 hypothetical protein KTJ85_10105 [Bacillus sp. 7D3]QZY10177.1 hypothetical protein K7B13_10330 [Bacillus amyloliquefaciens]
MSMRVSGMRQLVSEVRKLGNRAKYVEKGALEAGAEPVFNEMEANKRSSQSVILKGEVKNGVIDIGPSELDFISRFAEFGTSPHLIELKNKKVMSDGSNIYGKKVDHPGHKAEPFVEPALINKQSEALSEMKKYIQRNLIR